MWTQTISIDYLTLICNFQREIGRRLRLFQRTLRTLVNNVRKEQIRSKRHIQGCRLLFCKVYYKTDILIKVWVEDEDTICLVLWHFQQNVCWFNQFIALFEIILTNIVDSLKQDCFQSSFNLCFSKTQKFFRYAQVLSLSKCHIFTYSRQKMKKMVL